MQLRDRNSISCFSRDPVNYDKHRPDYPEEAIDRVSELSQLRPDAVIAEPGSGTGILTKHFVTRGFLVYGIEPNPDMRHVAEAKLKAFSNFRSICAYAEATTLPDASTDLVVIAEAAHWFDPNAARAELARVLKPGGCVAVLQNVPTNNKLFSDAKAALGVAAQHQVFEKPTEAPPHDLRWYLPDHALLTLEFANACTYDLSRFIGRTLSESDAVSANHPGYLYVLQALTEVFRKHERNGSVQLGYVTHLQMAIPKHP